MIPTVPPAALRPEQSCALTKPRMASLIVFTTVIGVLLTTPGMMSSRALVLGAIGIALVTGAAVATICLLTKIDVLMASTRGRPRGGQLNEFQKICTVSVFWNCARNSRGTS